MSGCHHKKGSMAVLSWGLAMTPGASLGDPDSRILHLINGI